MYAVSGYNQKFYTINLQTGLATQTGSTGIGFQNGGGFAASSKGAFYGVSNFSFYSYNKTTGQATFIGLTLLPNLVRAAAFDPNDVLYGMEGGGGIDNLHLRFLVTFNLTTGLGLEVGPVASTTSTRWLSFLQRNVRGRKKLGVPGVIAALNRAPSQISVGGMCDARNSRLAVRPYKSDNGVTRSCSWVRPVDCVW
jgi:hypothetical protein